MRTWVGHHHVAALIHHHYGTGRGLNGEMQHLSHRGNAVSLQLRGGAVVALTLHAHAVELQREHAEKHTDEEAYQQSEKQVVHKETR